MATSSLEKRARELSQAVRAIGGKPLSKGSSQTVTFVAKQERGEQGLPGKDGKDAVIDMEKIAEFVIEKIRKEQSIDISQVRNASQFIFNKTKYGTHEMMHGGGSSSDAATQVVNEIVSGSGTSWTLAHTPDDDDDVALYAIGQRLTPGGSNDYTISGTLITTANPWSAGQLLADYSFT